MSSSLSAASLLGQQPLSHFPSSSSSSSSSSLSSSSSPPSIVYRSVADDYRVSAVSLASQVHKAIRDGDYKWLPDLVGDKQNDSRSRCCPEILWEANSSGWTALHFAASHFLPWKWWNWILEQASSCCCTTSKNASIAATEKANSNNNNNQDARNNKFVTSRNDLGETIFDIFFQSFLAPLPWQSKQVKNRSNHLLKSIQDVCHNNIYLQQTRNLLSNGPPPPDCLVDEDDDDDEDKSKGREIYQDSSQNIAESVVQCVRLCWNLELLCRAAETGSIRDDDDDHKYGKLYLSSPSLYRFESKVLPFLAKTTGGCPEPLAQLLLALYPQQAKTLLPGDETGTGCYLLHMWCSSGRSFCRSLTAGLQRPLLRAFPEAASIPDPKTQRFPLHFALASGKTWDEVKPLFEAAPCVLQCVDPVTQLFPFALVALPHYSDYNNNDDDDDNNNNSNKNNSDPALPIHHYNKRNSHANAMIEIRARQQAAGDKGLVSLWHIMPRASRQEALERAAKELDCEQLTSIYLALRACPRALPTTTITTAW